MTDYLPDTPVLARYYCPGCDLDADPTREILEPRWCNQHEPRREGRDDERVPEIHLSGTAEAGGDDNRRLCALIHGTRRA
jgi:hypothetical protein